MAGQGTMQSYSVTAPCSWSLPWTSFSSCWGQQGAEAKSDECHGTCYNPKEVVAYRMTACTQPPQHIETDDSLRRKKEIFQVHLAAEPLGDPITVNLKIRPAEDQGTFKFFLKCTKGFFFFFFKTWLGNNISQQAYFALFCCVGPRKAQGKAFLRL